MAKRKTSTKTSPKRRKSSPSTVKYVPVPQPPTNPHTHRTILMLIASILIVVVIVMLMKPDKPTPTATATAAPEKDDAMSGWTILLIVGAIVLALGGAAIELKYGEGIRRMIGNQDVQDPSLLQGQGGDDPEEQGNSWFSRLWPWGSWGSNKGEE